MDARASLISFYSAPKTHLIISPKPTLHSRSRLLLQLCPCQRAHLPSIYARNGFIWRRKIGRVAADVKSEPYDIAESPPESVQFGQLILADDDDDDGGDDASVVPWWEQFPKRWVIVLLCFSAFLLCNMDRVSNAFLLKFLFLSKSYCVVVA
ncbi:UNVERIFIED_CONTAM: Sodium-dependent phosphate transport protein 1, chloroplastic [Sesamum latifolium]|uniref:Sodium-dependent phosphate transport protein 1, chloroplastic n=1 Tax=Sesamum latifolium TaxID=2727402 RepID=A0AAW2XYZ1_9LAMI